MLNLTGLQPSQQVISLVGSGPHRPRGRPWLPCRLHRPSRPLPCRRYRRSSPLQSGMLTPMWSPVFRWGCRAWTVSFPRMPLRNLYAVKRASARFPMNTSNDCSTRTSFVSSKAGTARSTWIRPRSLATYLNLRASRVPLTSPKSLALTRKPSWRGTSAPNSPWRQGSWPCEMQGSRSPPWSKSGRAVCA